MSQDCTNSPPAFMLKTSSTGAIHIEFPGRALVSVECRADTALVRAVLESLRG